MNQGKLERVKSILGSAAVVFDSDRRQIGATVLTRNERDFRLIQDVAPFSLVVDLKGEAQ